MPKSKKSKTHFEQVPLEIVVEMLLRQAGDEANGSNEIDATPEKAKLHPRVPRQPR
jgi:hypothetical protein